MKIYQVIALCLFFLLTTTNLALASKASDDDRGSSDRGKVTEPEEPIPPDSNLPPTISGTPDTTVIVEQTYSFTPIASDPDGDTLTFSVINLPVWAGFDSATGKLVGIPYEASIGLHEDIVIFVSDGTASTSLEPFDITVITAATTTGSANLSWVIPTTRSDGSVLPLEEIGGYRLYMGETSDSLSEIDDLPDNSATSYTVSNLAAATYFFAVKVYDTQGNESAFSNIVSKTIQ
jgi:hypothetical protein